MILLDISSNLLCMETVDKYGFKFEHFYNIEIALTTMTIIGHRVGICNRHQQQRFYLNLFKITYQKHYLI